jgi:DNA polymerase III subunit delta
MSITPVQLHAQLVKTALGSAYLLAGEEPLLLEEAADAVRTKARAEGYSERDVLYYETGFDWHRLHAAGENLSLFASRRILELRLGDKSPGVDGSKALLGWLERPPADTLLLVHAGKLDKRGRESAWFTAFEKQGVAVYAWPVTRADLPRWIESRLQAAGLRAQADALDLLSARTEGNLLACAQEIEKLKLLCSDGQVSVERIQEATADSARFDAFDLIDKILKGQPAAVLQVLARLREEGVEVIPVVAALAYTLRQLYQASRQLADGQPLERALSAARVWGPRQAPFKQALRRLPPDKLLEFIKESSWVDQVAKGAGWVRLDAGGKANNRLVAWEELVKLATRLSGVALRETYPA